MDWGSPAPPVSDPTVETNNWQNDEEEEAMWMSNTWICETGLEADIDEEEAMWLSNTWIGETGLVDIDELVPESCIRGRNLVLIDSHNESPSKQDQQLKNAHDQILEPKSMEGKIYMGVVKRVLNEMNARYTYCSSAFPLWSQNESGPGQEGDQELTEAEILHREFIKDIWCNMVVRVADRIRTALKIKCYSSHVHPVVINRNESLTDEDVKELQVREVLIIHQLFENVKILMQNILRDGVLMIDSQNIESPPQEGEELTEAQSLEPEFIFKEEIYNFVMSKVLAEAETPFVFPPGSQSESPGQEGDEELKEAEILDLNIMKKVWSHMVKRVAHRMLSTLELSDEAHYLAEDLWSHLNALRQDAGQEELKTCKILISPIVELIENFKERMKMIPQEFKMDHPTRKRKFNELKEADILMRRNGTM